MNAFRNFLNSIFNTLCFSVLRRLAHRPVCGNNNANHAFNAQASEAITIYAQLLIRLSTGICIARAPFFNCSIRFS